MKTFKSNSGQATTEIVIMLPLFLLLAFGAIAITYICWQGIKVQEAANLAARIQGQERISGGHSEESIRQDNGLDGGFDKLPTAEDLSQLDSSDDGLSGFKSKPAGGVYGRYYQAVHDMFGKGEQKKLFVPPPTNVGLNTDTIKVVRVLNPPKFFDFKLKPIRLEATAYGGEDVHMYALPRWGSTEGSSDQFYQGQIKE
jgi:hypothetical protein